MPVQNCTGRWMRTRIWPNCYYQSAVGNRRIRSSPPSARISATWGEGGSPPETVASLACAGIEREK